MSGSDVLRSFNLFAFRNKSLLSFVLSFLVFISPTYLYCETHNSKKATVEKTLYNKKLLHTIIVDKYYPYTFVNNAGKPDGFSVDLIKAVTKAMDLELEIRVDIWDKARNGLETGEIDLLPMMAYSKARDEYFDFSSPHTIAFDAFFTNKNKNKIKSLNDLRNKTIIVMGRDQAYDYLQSVDFISQDQLILIKSIPEALKMLASGKGDTALMPKLVGLVFIKQMNLTTLEMSPIVIEAYQRPFSFAVKEGNQVLLERLTQGLMIIKETGQYQTLYKKWFGAYETAGVSLRKVLKYVISGIAVFLLISAILLLWSLSLKKQVALRTSRLEKEVKVRKIAESEMQKAHDELEYRVRERTAELTKTNKRLGIEITQRKQVEEQRKNLLEDLVLANTELKDFSYTVSHDLKAPLRGISSIVRWLSEDYSDSLDEKGQEYLDKLLLRAKRMHNLIEGILQYSRVGRINANPKSLDSNIIFQDIIDSISPPENITMTIEQSLPNIMYDETLFRQVAQNLIGNAVEHHGKPSGEVIISCEDQDKSWEFCVKDDGVGIEKKHHDRVFKIFQSLKPPSADGSTGIGLSLIKKIIEYNNGKVRLESSANEGSAFFFTIPKKIKPQMRITDHTVLIVDDNKEFTEVATALLQSAGYKALSALSGPEAYEILKTGPHAISSILFDIEIPGETPLDRYNILKRMKPEMKIIVCTGLNTQDNEFLKQVKVDGILTKPFTIDELNNILKDNV